MEIPNLIMTKSNVATMRQRNSNKTHPRLKNAPLVKALEAIRLTETTNALTRQRHLTELMLNDIVKHGNDESKSCTYRLTESGEYFMAANGVGNKKSVQLSEAARKRLTELNGGKVTTQKGKKIYTGLFSDQDFRRGFDYIKVSGKMVKHADENVDGDNAVYTVYEVDDVDVNNAMRNGKGWDNLGKKKKAGDRSTSKRNEKATMSAIISKKGMSLFVDGTGVPEPLKSTGKFKNKKESVEIVSRILKYCAGQLRNHADMSCKLSINGKDW